MKIPNNVGFVVECLEERPLVSDESGRQSFGDPKVRFKLKLRNTLGQEMVAWAVLEDPLLKEEIDGFLNPVPKTYHKVARTVEELAQQLDADLSGEKDFHDKVVDEAEAHNPPGAPQTVSVSYIQLFHRLEVELKQRIDQYLAEKLV